MKVIAHFFLLGIFKFHKTGIGKITIARSMIKLTIATERYAFFESPQTPAIALFQVYSKGRHRRNDSKITTPSKAKDSVMTM
jgi:hypothetical protein